MDSTISWQCFSFDELSTHQLYQLLKLRTEIFVVEQNCAYLETDGKDILPNVKHLLAFEQDEIVAAARLLPPNVSFDSVSIGRIVVAERMRGQALGHQLVARAIAECQRLWPEQSIKIGAQHRLVAFYQHHDFKVISTPYDEDGILHIDMQRMPSC